MKRFAIFLVLLLSFELVSVSPAHGQDASEETSHQSAVRLGHRGLGHFSAGRFAQARDDFEAAESRAHSPVFLLYQARAERNLGSLLKARGLLERCIRESINEATPAAWKGAVREAHEEMDRLSREIPSVRFLVEGGVKYPLEIRVGEGAVQTTRKSEFVHEFDPGVVEFWAVDAGGTKLSSRIVLSAGEKEKVVILAFPRLLPLQEQDPSTLALRAFSENFHSDRALRRGAYTAFFLGGSAFIFSAVATSVAVSQARAVKRHCIEKSCRPEDQDLGQSAIRWANLATAGVVVGTTGAAAGLGLLLLSDREGAEVSYRRTF